MIFFKSHPKDIISLNSFKDGAMKIAESGYYII